MWDKVKEDTPGAVISNADIFAALMGFKADVAKNIGRLETKIGGLEDKMDTKLKYITEDMKNLETNADKRNGKNGLQT